MAKHIVRFLAVACVCVGGASAAFALEPFDNWDNPPGVYGAVYPLHVNGQELTDKDGNAAISNVDMHVTETVLRALYYNTHHWIGTAVLPVGRMDFLNQHQVGLGDPTFAGGYFLIDNKEKNLYFGPGLKVDAPWGKYDKSSFANMGNNYWRYRPMLCFAKFAVPVDFEASVLYDIKEVNKEKLIPTHMGPMDVKYDPGDLIEFETYTGMFLSKQWLIGAHVNYMSGKDDKYDIGGGFNPAPGSGVRDWQLGGSVTFLESPNFHTVLEVMQDVHARNTVPATLIMAKIAYKLY